MPGVEIRFYQSNYLGSTVDCFIQLLLHYSPEKIFRKSALREKITKKFADDLSSQKLIVALDCEQVVGLATMAELFPAVDDTTQLFLKDLFVIKDYRRRGIATEIMKFISQYAIDSDMSRIDWLVDSDNDAAMSFYKRLVNSPMSYKTVFRLENEALRKVSAER